MVCDCWRWGGEWTHLGLGSTSECGRETLLDRGVEWLIVLALGSPVPVPVAMPGKKPAMEERRDECWDDEG